LALQWESFKWLQVPGFMLLIYGTLIFNDVVQPPAVLLKKNATSPAAQEQVDPETEPLIAGQ
jgi:hypothetical protein